MDDTYSGTRVITQAVKLPKELGEFMYNKYKEDKNYYKDASAFIKNVLKGITYNPLMEMVLFCI